MKKIKPQSLTIQIIEKLSAIDAKNWNALVNTNPFLSYEFLNGLEVHGCLDKQGWQPCHLTVYDQKKLIGTMPLYIKYDSWGEFVFDWEWAEAHHRLGQPYYPKLVSAIPFTPVSGPRLLFHPDYSATEIQTLLVQQAIQIVKQNPISSVHCLFQTDLSPSLKQQYQLLERRGYQYWWRNQGYQNFSDFLSQLRSKKRKQINFERRKAKESGAIFKYIEGTDITESQWHFFYECYCKTFNRKANDPRFTLEFLIYLGQSLPNQTMLFFAYLDNKPIASALVMHDQYIAYGRHWGCSVSIPFIHFELCYYQLIEYCIAHQLNFHAGAQGEHKINRGFTLEETYSWHWLKTVELRQPVVAFLEAERQAIHAHHKNTILHMAYNQKSGKTLK